MFKLRGCDLVDLTLLQVSYLDSAVFESARESPQRLRATFWDVGERGEETAPNRAAIFALNELPNVCFPS